jgi:hypothetical protein
MSKRDTIASAVLAQLKDHKTLTEKQRAHIANAIASEYVATFPEANPGEAEVRLWIMAREVDKPQDFRAVPSMEDVIAGLSKNTVNPTQRLQIAHEVAAMSEDERLAALPYEKGEQFTPAQEPTGERKNAPSLRERCEAQALDFHGQSPTARLAQARALSATHAPSKPDTASAIAAVGRKMRPVERLKAAREAARR